MIGSKFYLIYNVDNPAAPGTLYIFCHHKWLISHVKKACWGLKVLLCIVWPPVQNVQQSDMNKIQITLLQMDCDF